MKKKVTIMAVAAGIVLVSAPTTYAALTDSTNFSQQINAGVLSTFIGDTSGAEVASPNVGFSNVTVSTSTQTSTGTYGTNTQRIYVDNPGGANNGWTLALAATGGPSAVWTSGGNTYAFNGASAALGQLTVNPAAGTITPVVGTATGVSLGSSGTFSGGTNTPVGLLSASSGSDDISRVYLTGVGVSQTIPAAQVAGSYIIDFTQTAAAV